MLDSQLVTQKFLKIGIGISGKNFKSSVRHHVSLAIVLFKTLYLEKHIGSPGSNMQMKDKKGTKSWLKQF